MMMTVTLMVSGAPRGSPRLRVRVFLAQLLLHCLLYLLHFLAHLLFQIKGRRGAFRLFLFFLHHVRLRSQAWSPTFPKACGTNPSAMTDSCRQGMDPITPSIDDDLHVLPHWPPCPMIGAAIAVGLAVADSGIGGLLTSGAMKEISNGPQEGVGDDVVAKFGDDVGDDQDFTRRQ